MAIWIKHGKAMVTCCTTTQSSPFLWWYPLMKVYISTRKDPPCYENGKIHNFDWAMFNGYVKSQEGSSDSNNEPPN